MPSNLTIIIPTLTNTPGLLSELKTLKNFPLIVIDNAPTPGKRLACSRHSRCLYLPQKTNQGFARAINLAVPHVQTDWICILNDDIQFLAQLPFNQLISLAEQNNWSAISPLLTKQSGEIENLGYRVLPQGRVELVYSSQEPLDGLTAACLVIKTAVFRALDGFDGRFFAYLEDVDLFLRFKKAGYQFGVANNIRVIHNHMTTSGKMNNFKAKMDFKNWLFVIIKNWSIRELFLNFPAIFVERLRNLSGLAKATWKSYGARTLYIFPRDLLWVSYKLITFPFLHS